MKLNWGWRIAIVYTIFALCTLGFVASAVSTRVDLVQEDYYEASLRHNETAAERARTSDSLVAVNLVQGAISVHFRQEQAVEKVAAHLYRADDPSLDRKFAIVVNDSGSAMIDVATMRSGQWRLFLTWQVGGTPYRLEKKINIPGV